MEKTTYTPGSDAFVKTARPNPRMVDSFFDDAPEAENDFQSGDIQLERELDGRTTLWLACPGCGSVSPLAIRPVDPQNSRPSWELSGTDQAPTLRPSINHLGCWHGWLTDGQFTLSI